MDAANSLVSSIVAAGGATTAIAANAGLEHFSGINGLGMMTPNPVYAMLAGAAFGKGQFKGAFGYKTLLRGMQPTGFTRARDAMTIGGVVLPLAELGAKAAIGMNVGKGSLFMHGMASARKYGIGNIVSSSVLDVEGILSANPLKGNGVNRLRTNVMSRLNMGIQDGQLVSGMVGSESNSLISLAANAASEDEFLDLVKATKTGRLNMGIGAKGGKIGATLKEGKQTYQALYKIVQRGKKSSVRALTWLSVKNWMEAVGSLEKVSLGGKATGFMMNTASSKSMAILAKGSTLARGMSVLSALSLIQIGGSAAMWAGGAMIEGASQALSYGLDMVMDSQRMELANGKLAPVFMGPNAATERQRAVKAAYNSKVNPSTRMYGNEAGYMHR